MLTKILNGGSGYSTVAGTDFRVTLTNGSTFDVDLDSSTQVNLQQIVDAIKAAHDAAYPATASSFLVDLNGAGNGLRLRDTYGGASNLSVAALNGSSAATNLGILGTGSAGALQGSDIDRQFISTAMRLSDLNRGLGIYKGSFQVVDRAGKVFTVDASSSTLVTVADLVNQFTRACGRERRHARRHPAGTARLGNGSGPCRSRTQRRDDGHDLNLDQSVSASPSTGPTRSRSP